ncbi:MAG: hypothetical protein IKR19_07575 [Acholeplasmatales bacterium]|nr:hypothetical protein [Acholeplasmatales bacterium]
MQKVKIKLPKKKYEPEATSSNEAGGGLPQIQYDENGDPISTPECPVDVEGMKKMKALMEKVTAETREHESRMIMWATPMVLRVRGRKNNESVLHIASLTFLCVNGLNEFLTITRNFLLEDVMEGEILKDLDLHFDNLSTNVKICVDQIINRSKCYISEFDFQIESPDTKVVKLPCYDSKTSEETIFELTTDSYMGLKYIEDMIMRCAVDETHFLNFTTLISSKGDFSVGFFEIQQIDGIIALTSGERSPRGLINKIKSLFTRSKGTDQLAVVIKARRRPPKPAPRYEYSPLDTEEEHNNKTIKAEAESQREWDAMEDDEVTLIMPYDADGVYYKKSKFKGMTIELMENAYFGADIQYYTTITNYNCNIGGKNYVALRGKNKPGQVYNFLIDDDNMKKLNKLIEEY